MSENTSVDLGAAEQKNRRLFFAWAAVLPLLVMIVGVALAHFEVLPAFRGFLIYVLAGLVSILHTALLLLMRWVLPAKPPVKIILSAAFPALIVVASASSGMGYPPINDVTTDLSSPPEFDAVANLPDNADRDMSFPSDFVETIRESYPQLSPFHLVGPQPTREEMFDVALNVAKEEPGWSLHRIDETNGMIEGTAQTWLFRFKDDFAIRVREVDGDTVLDMRSKSRDGKGDLGANAKRIDQFIARVRSRLHAGS